MTVTKKIGILIKRNKKNRVAEEAMEKSFGPHFLKEQYTLIKITDMYNWELSFRLKKMLFFRLLSLRKKTYVEAVTQV